MAELIKSRQVWFRVVVASGILLGVVLLVQTVATYVYVSGNLVTEAALSDAERRGQFLQRSLWRVDLTDSAAVESILTDALADWEETVGWVRVLDRSGDVLALGGAAATADFVGSEAMRGGAGENRDGPSYQITRTDLGSVLVMAVPFRFGLRQTSNLGGGAAAQGDAAGPAWLEIAVDLESVSASFSPLRRNLIIGVTAAFALLGMVLIIGLRFPHYLRGKQLEGQMELARAVQGNLLPTKTAHFRDAEIAADCTPVSQLGGDFYDVFDLPGGELGIMLGDVSGKGVSAAPLMGFIHGAVHASSWTDSSGDHEAASGRLNDLLHRKTAMDRFVTLFWGYFERPTSVFRYVNAGHCPPILFRARTHGNELVRLEEGGPVLGAIPGVEYRQGSVEVEDGDLLVMYSDGIVEATAGSGEDFGEARVLASVRRHREGTVSEIRDGILKDLADFRNGTGSQDDQTLVVVRFRPDPVGEPFVRDEPVAVSV